MTEEFNKDRKILKKSNWNLENEISISQIKTSNKSLDNTEEQFENRVSRIKYKVEKLDWSDKDAEKILKEY
jgi:hypothetical protein